MWWEPCPLTFQGFLSGVPAPAAVIVPATVDLLWPPSCREGKRQTYKQEKSFGGHGGAHKGCAAWLAAA